MKRHELSERHCMCLFRKLGYVCVYVCVFTFVGYIFFLYTGRDIAFEEIVSDFKLCVKGSCQRNNGIQFQLVQEQGN